MEYSTLEEIRSLCRQVDELDAIIQQELVDPLQLLEYKAARENRLKRLQFIVSGKQQKA